ncbi:MAG: response regulator [Chloroflexota bacterium]
MPTVLYIEDDNANIELIKRYLTVIDCDFVSATDGGTGITVAADINPDVILLDMYLPDMHGMDVAEQIKAMPALSNIPIVALTTDDSDELERACLDRGITAVLHKPVRPQNLLETVQFYSA